MKILLLSSEFPPGPGGIGTHAYELARGFHALGHEVEVVAPQDYVSVDDATQFRQTLPFRLLPPARRHGALRRLMNIGALFGHLRRFKPDMFIASGGGAVVAAAILAGRRPWLAVAHGTEIHAGSRLSIGLTRWGFGRASAVVSVSRYTESQLLDVGALPRRSCVIYNGADEDLVRLADESPPLTDLIPDIAGCPVILTVGNVTERKGQQVVVRSLPAVLEQVPDAHYVAIGLATDGDELMRLARSLGVADRVHLTGPLPTAALARAFRDATVLAMTSRHTSAGDFEGFGIAAVEAALLGTPAVVSQSGGLPEAVIDGVTGVTVPENDPVATAAAIVELVRDPDRTAALGEAARARAADELVWSAVVTRYDRLIRSIVDPSPDHRRLIFISDTPHYLKDGVPYGWAATIREIDVLAQLFDEIVHVTPLYAGMDEFAVAPYQSDNVTVRFLRQAGGDDIRQKLGVLLVVGSWWRAIANEIRQDPTALVHARGPSSVALFAVLRSATWRRQPIHWFKYAGNWQPDADRDYDALTYVLQRWILRTIHRGPITVNGRWPDQPSSVHTFINPTYTTEELASARSMATGKALGDEVRLLFVGRLHPTKGPLRVLAIAEKLLDEGANVHVDIVGDGSQRAELDARIASTALNGHVYIHGWVQRERLAPMYAKAHFLVLPSMSEGFPKVVSEAMSFGAIPIAGAVSSIPQILADLGVGRALPSEDIDAFVSVIREYMADPQRWQSESTQCIESAQDFSFDTYLANVVALFHDVWGIDLQPAPRGAPSR